MPYNDQTKLCSSTAPFSSSKKRFPLTRTSPSSSDVGEALNHDFSMVMNGAELYWEPELEAGYIAELLEKGGRVLDLGGFELEPVASRLSARKSDRPSERLQAAEWREFGARVWGLGFRAPRLSVWISSRSNSGHSCSFRRVRSSLPCLLSDLVRLSCYQPVTRLPTSLSRSPILRTGCPCALTRCPAFAPSRR